MKRKDFEKVEAQNINTNDIDAVKKMLWKVYPGLFLKTITQIASGKVSTGANTRKTVDISIDVAAVLLQKALENKVSLDQL